MAHHRLNGVPRKPSLPGRTPVLQRGPAPRYPLGKGVGIALALYISVTAPLIPQQAKNKARKSRKRRGAIMKTTRNVLFALLLLGSVTGVASASTSVAAGVHLGPSGHTPRDLGFFFDKLAPYGNRRPRP